VLSFNTQIWNVLKVMEIMMEEKLGFLAVLVFYLFIVVCFPYTAQVCP
jgi:hypothetical protein